MSTRVNEQTAALGERISRRGLLGVALAVAVVSTGGCHASQSNGPSIHIFKSASCQCCKLWAQYLRDAGFDVSVENTEDLPKIKQGLAVPSSVQSCHTAQIGGYFIEGHVPSEDIRRLLEQHPNARGLAVPGMPVGSPGMESPSGERQSLQVLLVGTDGSTSVFSEHAAVTPR